MKRRKMWIIAVTVLVPLAVLGVAGWKYHEQPQFCVMCHVMDPYLESWQSSDYLAGAHAEEGIVCLDCHEPTLQQQGQELIVTVKGDYPNRLQMRRFPKEECFECHKQEEVIESTADYETARGDELNPHTMTVDENTYNNPHESGEGELECYECHKVHRRSGELTYCYARCHHERNFTESCGSPDCHESMGE